jgi:hypothetical protein
MLTRKKAEHAILSGMSAKIGRNDHCPCGSGKKYKLCHGLTGEPVLTPDNIQKILGFAPGTTGQKSMEAAQERYRDYVENSGGESTFMEFLGRPNAATSLSKALAESLKGKTFDSEEDEDAFIADFSSRQNRAPKPDFLGLSSEQMHTILYCREFDELEGIVRLSKTPFGKLAEKSRLVRILRFVLALYAEQNGELPITATGNYKQALVAECVYLFYDDEDMKQYARNEPDVDALFLVHSFLIHREYVTENKTKSRLTDAGKRLLEETDAAELWKILFDYFLHGADWLSLSYIDDEDSEFQFLQRAAVFSLYLISKTARTWTESGDAYARFETAFPYFARNDEGDREEGETLFTVLFVNLFCFELGLIEYTPKTARKMRFLRKFRVTPLMDAAFEWQAR